MPDAGTALRELADGQVDVVVVDLDRADGRGAETVTAIREGYREARVLAVTTDPAPDAAALALAAGAHGVIPSEHEARDVLDACRRVLAGELVLPARDLPSLVDRVRGRAAPVSDAVRLASLTGREREILSLLADGRATNDVAASLGISPQTVQSHVKNVLAKLGVHTKVDAVRLAWRHGLQDVTHSA